jgi:hypothetical protein
MLLRREWGPYVPYKAPSHRLFTDAFGLYAGR